MKHIWRPDTIMNINDQISSLYMEIHSNGSVFYSALAVVKTQCSMEFTYFPVDLQVCTFSLESGNCLFLNAKYIKLSIFSSFSCRFHHSLPVETAGKWLSALSQ